MPNLVAWSPRVLSLLRIVVGLLFMEHGLMKLFHFPGPQPGAPDPLPVQARVRLTVVVVRETLLLWQVLVPTTFPND